MGNPPELYYKVLNITRDTPPQEIRAAYRCLVRQWHPDKHPPESKTEAEAMFKAITQAYEVTTRSIHPSTNAMARTVSILTTQNSEFSLALRMTSWPGFNSFQALLDQQENRAVLRACSHDAGRRSCSSADKGARAPESEKASAGTRTSAAPPPPPHTPPARESQKVYSSTDVGGGGRRAFAEFSSYVVRKAPPLERKVECTLEELCAGCRKEVRYTRDVVTKNG
jgi:DnaJ family protein B protein 13